MARGSDLSGPASPLQASTWVVHSRFIRHAHPDKAFARQSMRLTAQIAREAKAMAEGSLKSATPEVEVGQGRDHEFRRLLSAAV